MTVNRDSKPGGESAQNGPRSLTGIEKAAAFRKWVNDFPSDLPILSLDDMSRESIYQNDYANLRND